MPICAVFYRIHDLLNHSWLRLDTALKVKTLNLEKSLLAVGFGVQAPDQPAAMEDWKREVSIAAFSCGGVTLDGEIKVK